MIFKFRLVESTDNEKFNGWLQEDIELYESVDWDSMDDNEDYDAGYAYIDYAIGDDEGKLDGTPTEFHKYLSRDPYQLPYYMPSEKNPFDDKKYEKSIPEHDKYFKGNYPVRNRYTH